MQTLLLRFSPSALAEGQKLLDSQQVSLPLRWVEPNVLEGLVKKPSGAFHNCRVVLNDQRTSILKEYCTCRSENISQSTCAHIIAIVIAYEDNPAGVSPCSPPASNGTQSKASGPHKSTPPAHQPTKVPGGSANKSRGLNSKGGKKLAFRSSTPTEAAAGRPVRDDSQLELDDRTKELLHDVANAFVERDALLESVDAPSLVYLVRDTEPGAFPELKIINLKGRDFGVGQGHH